MDNRQGLRKSEIDLSRRLHGENRFSEKKRQGFLSQFFRGFSDPMILILLAALVLNVLFVARDGDFAETIGIAAAIFLSVFVSTLSEYSGERAFEKLSAEAQKLTCAVRRDGAVQTVSAAEVVVGDIVLLTSGDTVPADGRVIYGSVGVDQSTLNGESREKQKYPSEDASSLSSPGALFSGTVVSNGDAEMVVERVGDATLYGTLAGELQQGGRKSPLKEKLSRLARLLSFFGYGAALLVAGADLLYAVFSAGGGDLVRGFSAVFSSPGAFAAPLLHALTLAVTVVVVAVPEGLPMMITVVLSSQMRRMMRQGVLVRKLSGIETAGTMDLLFCDKTGTLTEGRHTVQNLFCFQSGTLQALSSPSEGILRHLTLNNQASLRGGKPHGSNATDRALLTFALAEGAPKNGAPPQVRIPFDSARKYSAVQTEDGRVSVKGAPEKLIALAAFVKDGDLVKPLTAEIRALLTKHLRAVQSEGVRLIAFAEGRGTIMNGHLPTLTLVFFAALSDPVRPETAATVSRLTGAGVQVVMLTGDARATALAIAAGAGITKSASRAVSGEELGHLTDAEILSRLPALSVVYRCTPADKSRLAALAAEAGRVVGMTGDGVNDAPALKRADVGFCMGSGTQIARDAADIILTDDRLYSLSNAVLYGRTVFRSIRKFLIFQLTMNFCAVLVSFLGPLFGVDTPITVTQMLWVNLIMDTLASLAFAGEPPRERYLAVPPLKRDCPILSREVLFRILFGTLYSVTLSCLFLSSGRIRAAYGYVQNETPFLTAFFLLFIALGAFNLFNVRTERLNLLADLKHNPGFLAVFFLILSVQTILVYFGGAVFRCAPLSLARLAFPLLLALTILPADLLRKGRKKKK